jgi:RNA-directed DNA polymerase
MRRLRGAFQRMTSFEALWRASRRARRGKRCVRGAALFEYGLEENLLCLQDELRSGSFRFSGYRTFVVREPVQREIRAAPYRDRVVHHALCAELEPVIERHLIHDTYACRVGKGTHRALDRLQGFLRGGAWVVKVDVSKYFFSIDHELLQALLRRLTADPRLEELVAQLLGTYDAGPEYSTYPAAATDADVFRSRGLPIGNLTSQLFANYFLAPVDRFIKEELKVRRYLRYMDDLVLVAPDRATAREWLRAVRARLLEARLVPHPKKTQLLPVRNGVRFLGFRVWPHHRRIQRQNLKRFCRRMRRYSAAVGQGRMTEESLRQSLAAWLGYAGKIENREFLNEVLAPLRFHPPGALRPWAFWLPAES